MKMGLEFYGNNFNYRSIRGDGHCLFRSIAASIALDINRISGNEKAKALFFDSIQRSVNELQVFDSQLPDLWQKTRLLLRTLKGTEESLQTAMQNSDPFVHFLRVLACATIVGHPELMNIDLVAEGSTAEGYLNAMKSMGGNNPVYGGHPELLALAFALNRPIQVLKPQDTGLQIFLEASLPVADHHINPTQASSPPICLLHRGMHYDLALQKS